MDKEIVKQLKKALPTGWSRIITERLAEKGIQTTPRNVQFVVNGKSKNPDIQAEILKLLDEPTPQSEFEKKVLEKIAEKKKPLAY